ncbi:MAG: hypothetical protein KAH10_05405 [Flavobacteriales bacterium]|nr:hypothetical protein [Flavobacteriales bacterium]
MTILNTINIKITSLLLVLVIITSSCKVYRHYDIPMDTNKFEGKDVYMQFHDKPHLMYKLSDIEVEGDNLKARLSSDFKKLKKKKAIILWRKEAGDLEQKDNQLVNMDLREFDRVEAYRYSKGATALEVVGIGLGVAIITYFVMQE